MDTDSFEAALICALWNSGDRDGWILYEWANGRRLLVARNRTVSFFVRLNPDCTIEPD